MKMYRVTLSGMRNGRPHVQTCYMDGMSVADAKSRAMLLCGFFPVDNDPQWEVVPLPVV